MKNRILRATLLIATLFSVPLHAYEPAVETLDAGEVTTFIQNDATFGYDPTASRVGGVGMYYPGDSHLWVLAGGGLWVAGFREGEWRASASGRESDFVPGPYPANGVSFDTLYPIYKVTRGDDTNDDDYRNWPVHHGAPTTAGGQPLIKGAQALFTVFNDADTAGHVLDNFTGTLPLGIEVRAYYYSYDKIHQVVDTTLAQVMFVDYEVINITAEPIDSCILTVYADPDIGASLNDRVGSLDTLQAVYAYNDSENDVYSGSSPPVVGMTMLKNRAISGNFYWFCRFGGAPCAVFDTVTQVVNLMKGNRYQGSPYFDPITSLLTRYPYGGDPVDSTGWLVPTSEDYRMMLSTAPLTLGAGERFTMTAAVTVVRGTNVDDSIIKTRELIATLREFFEPNALRPETAIASGEAVTIRGRGPSVDDWGGRFLGGGLDRAERYFNLPMSQGLVLPDVEITFAKSTQQEALRYIRQGADFAFAGMIDVPFSVRRSDAVQRMAVVVLDSSGNGDFLDTQGRLLPIVLLNQPNDQFDLPALGGSLYDLQDDFRYVVDLDETPDFMAGTTLEIRGEPIIAEFETLGEGALLEMTFPAADGFGERSISIKNRSDFWQEVSIVSDNPGAVSAIPNHLQLAPQVSQEIFLRTGGIDSEPASANILIESSSLLTDSLLISVQLSHPTGLTVGDADADGELTLSDLLYMIAILYKHAPIQVSIKQLDADCDDDFDLLDAVLFINYLYRRVEIPCQETLRP